MQDVPGMAQRAGLTFDGYLDPTQRALLDTEHLVRMNYEAFLFASAENRERFLADPTFYCGLLTDPVSKQRFRPDAKAPRAEHEGVVFLFESTGTQSRFLQKPDRYRLPGWGMAGPRDPAWEKRIAAAKERNGDGA